MDPTLPNKVIETDNKFSKGIIGCNPCYGLCIIHELLIDYLFMYWSGVFVGLFS